VQSRYIQYQATMATSDVNQTPELADVTVTGTAMATAQPMPPVADSQSVTTNEDTAKSITLTAHDPDSPTLTYSIVVGPSHGVLSGAAPNVIYTPASNYNGPDSFTFKANDGVLDSSVATVSIAVTPVNDNPVANADSAIVAEDSGATAINVLANDNSAGRGETLTVTAVTQGAHGSVTFTGTGVSYTPAANYNGPDSFTYTIGDGNGGSATATVTVTVTPVNDAPVAYAQSVTVSQTSSKAITLLAADVDSPTLTYSIVVGPSHGT